MPHRPRAAALVAAGTALVHGLLAHLVFPAGYQFTKYPRAAARYVQGTLPSDRLPDFSPLYLHLHAFLEAWWGPGAPVGGLVVGLQVAATAAAAALLYLLLRRFFPLWIASAGTAGFALSPGVVVYTPILEPEPFLILSLVGFLHYSLGGTARRHLVAGLFLALGVAVRPNVLPLLLLVPVYFLLREERSGGLRATGRVLVPALAVLLVLGLRNGLATGAYTPLGMNAGFVFFEGNNPLSSGRSAVYPPVVGELRQELPDQPDNPHLTYRVVAARSSGVRDGPISTAEANRFWSGRALRFMADHPGRAARLLASKLYFSFHDHGLHDLVVADRFEERLRTLGFPTVPVALLSALAVGGLVASLGRWRRVLLIYGLFGAQLATMVVFYVSERQRLAILPSLVFFACAGLAWLAGRPVRVRAAAAVVALVMAGLFALPHDLVRDDRHLWAAYRIAEESRADAFAAQAEGRLAEAARFAATSFAAAPWLRDYARPSGASFEPEGFAERALASLPPAGADPSSRFDRAQLLLEAGRLDRAAALLDSLQAEGHRFHRGGAQSSEPLYYRALAASARGRGDTAEARLRRALARTPGDPFALARLAAITGRSEPRGEIVRYFGEVQADLLVGVAHLEEGTGDRGVRALGRTVEALPGFWRARIYHAAAVGSQGELARAKDLFLRAMAERQSQVMLEDHIVPLFARAAESGNGDPAQAHLQHGLILAQYGRLDEALEVLRTAAAEYGGAEIVQAAARVEAMRAALETPDPSPRGRPDGGGGPEHE